MNGDNRKDGRRIDEKYEVADTSGKKATDVEGGSDTNTDNSTERRNNVDTQSNTDQDNETLGASIVGVLATLVIIVLERTHR